MKKRVAAAVLTALVACLAFALCGCTEPYNPDAAKKAPTVDASALKEEGVLHVGVNASSYPLAGQANGKMSGLDVDVAAAIGQELGLRVEFVDVGEDGVKALGGDEVDMVMSVESDAAKGKCWVSPGYAPSGISLFSMDESAALPKKGGDAVIAAQTSSLSAWLVSRQFGEGALKAEDDLKTVFKQLADGEVPYVAADAVVGAAGCRVGCLDAARGQRKWDDVNHHDEVVRHPAELIRRSANRRREERVTHRQTLRWLDRTAVPSAS